MSDTKILALVGKGGVGKTTLSAAFVRVLSEKYPDKKILAIDADPAVGLSTALGIDVGETLDDIRKDIIEKAEAGAGEAAVELLGEVRFRIFDTLVEHDKFAFLAIGRPEGAGCYCAINSYLKDVIAMISKDFDFVIIDGEAGIEQINRRVMEKVTHLFLISDASKKGMKVIETIKDVASELVEYEQCGVIVNRLEDEGLKDLIAFGDEDNITFIKSDLEHVKNDICGKSIFELSDTAPVLAGAREALNKMSICE